MSTNTLITRTSGRGIDPNHLRLLDRYGQIVGILRQRLGPDHAALLSEPMRMGSGSNSDITWYADGDLDLTPIGSLPAQAAAQIEQRLARLTADVAALAQDLSRQGEASRELGVLLRAAMRIPSRDCIWAAGEQPVLVDWGRQEAVTDQAPSPAAGAIIGRRDDREPEKTTQMRAAAADLPPRPAAVDLSSTPPPAPARLLALRSLALWLLFACLVTVIALQLLHACGLGSASWPEMLRRFLPQYCTLAAGADDGAQADLIIGLETQVRAAELALAQRTGTCSVTCPPVQQRAAVSPAPLPIQEEITRRLPANTERGRYLEITLAWEGSSDLDLHVRCPGGGEINFQTHEACGGKLVADLNGTGGTPQSRPIEHVIWADAPPATGVYTVGVALFDRHGDARPSIPYRVAIWRNGRVIREESRAIASTDGVDQVLTVSSPLE